MIAKGSTANERVTVQAPKPANRPGQQAAAAEPPTPFSAFLKRIQRDVESRRKWGSAARVSLPAVLVPEPRPRGGASVEAPSELLVVLYTDLPGIMPFDTQIGAPYAHARVDKNGAVQSLAELRERELEPQSIGPRYRKPTNRLELLELLALFETYYELLTDKEGPLARPLSELDPNARRRLGKLFPAAGGSRAAADLCRSSSALSDRHRRNLRTPVAGPRAWAWGLWATPAHLLTHRGDRDPARHKGIRPVSLTRG